MFTALSYYTYTSYVLWGGPHHCVHKSELWFVIINTGMQCRIHTLFLCLISHESFAVCPLYSDKELDKKLSYYDGDLSLPVYQWTAPNQHFSVEKLARLLIGCEVPKEKVCSKQPVRVCRNSAFVVDLYALDDPLPIRADENGVWVRKGSPVAYVSVHNTAGTVEVFRRSKMGTHRHHYKIVRTYYRHSSSSDFRRIITTVNGKV